MGNSRKNPNRCLVEGGHIFFEKETLEFLDLSLYQYSVQRKESFIYGNCAKFSDTPCLGNSIAKNQGLWKFHMIPPSVLFWIFSGIGYSRNQTVAGGGGGGVEDMEFPGVLKK